MDQPLEVVAGSHHGHCNVGSGLTNGTYCFSSHLFNSPKYVFDPCSGFGNTMVAPLLTFREWFVGAAFSLNLVAIAVLF